MKWALLSAISLGLLVTSTAFAQAPPVKSANQLPVELKRHIIALNNDCKGFGGQAGKSPQLVKFADLNADGIGDYVVDLNSYECHGAESAMQNGQSGAGLAIFIGGPGNTAAKVYEASVYGSRIEAPSTAPRLFIDVAALDCGQKNAASVPFSDWKFCSRPLDWNAAQRTFVYAPLSQARPIQ